MRPITTPSHTNIGSAVSETKFRLDSASTAHLVGVLTNQYSDRLLAFVRELSTNALDSHIVARNNGPIRVTLPTAVTPVFAVEDFGVGMSIDVLTDRYTGYGASDKRESDEVNGTLGIGSKAPLAYADTFTVQSRHDGVQALAVVTKDTDGVPLLRILDTSATDKPNGVRIEVPVREYDFTRLANTVDRFFQYWEKGTVLVNGQQPRSIRDDENLIWLDDDVAASTRHHDSVIVQHGVAYPIDYRHDDLPFNVIAYVPSGTVNFPPSREALEYTDRTEDVLRTLNEYAAEKFDIVIRQRVEQAKTTYERLLLVQEWRTYAPKVAQDFFGKFGLRVSLGGCGWGWRYQPRSYTAKARQITSLTPHDLIGEFPIITGYPLKSLSPKNRAKIDRYFEGKGHNQYLCLPPGTSLTAIVGRDEVHAWDTIDAATPDVKVPREAGYKGQTQYTVWHGGEWSTYTLREAKDFIAEFETAPAVAYADDARNLSARMPDVVIFEIKTNQEAKIQRETGAVNAWALAGERLRAAEAALTAEDLFKAQFSPTDFWGTMFAKDIERIEDPDVRTVLEAIRQPSSPRLRAFEALGGSTWNLVLPDDHPIVVLAEVTAERYPLLTNRYTRNAATVSSDAYEDALMYVNAKYRNTQNTEAPASPTLRKDQ